MEEGVGRAQLAAAALLQVLLCVSRASTRSFLFLLRRLWRLRLPLDSEVVVIPALKVPDCVIGIFASTSTGQVAPAPCGSWTCRRCGPTKKYKFLLRTMSVTYNWMLTLTYEDRVYLRRAREGERPDQYLNHCWRSFAQWLERNYGAVDFKNSWVNEHGALRGRAHKHVVVKLSRALNYKRARAAARRCGFGRQCRFDRITDSDGAACYLGKYLAKSLNEQWPHYARRCQNAAPAWREPMWSDIRHGDVEPQLWVFEKFTAPRGPRPLAEVINEQKDIRRRDELERLESIPRPPPEQQAEFWIRSAYGI